MKKKTCTRCGKAKEPADFPRDKRMRDGLNSWCWRSHNEARRVVPQYVYLDGATVPNPDPRPKSKVR